MKGYSTTQQNSKMLYQNPKNTSTFCTHLVGFSFDKCIKIVVSDTQKVFYFIDKHSVKHHKRTETKHYL